MSEPYVSSDSADHETRRDTGCAVSSPRRIHLVIVIVALMAVAIGCGGDDEGGSQPGSETASIVITDARMALPAAGDGAIYLTVENQSDRDDEVVGATTTISLMTHFHQSNIAGDGLADMDKLAGIPVPAGATVRLEPGAVHLMAMSPEPVSVGDRFEMTVLFRDAGPIPTTVEVVQLVEPST
jgi:copper(I)-binding protein